MMLGKLKDVYMTLRIRLTSERKRAFVIEKYLGVKFGNNVRLSGMASFGSEPYLITVGDNVTITKGVTFHNHDGGVGLFRSKYPGIDVIKPIVIGNNVFIGSNSTIMPGVIIGNNVIIGASSVVTKNVPNNVVIAGVPARVIKTIEEYEKSALENAIYIDTRNDAKLRKSKIIAALKDKGILDS